jgi:nitrate/nitrite transport system permease protein
MIASLFNPRSTFNSIWLDKLQGALQGERFVRLAAGLSRNLLIPLIAIAVFLAIWSAAASKIDTSLGTFPGPAKVWQQTEQLYHEHQTEREKETAFYARQHERNAERMKTDPGYEAKIRPYTGKPTFFDQILTSLLTVATGFLIASLIAIPEAMRKPVATVSRLVMI